MKALVTGGGGFVGLSLVRALVDRGIETAVVGRNRYPQVDKLQVPTLQGDIRDRNFLFKACQGFDTVFHVAAMAGIWGAYKDYEAVNVAGTANVIAACLANRVASLVYTSTPSVVFNRQDIEGDDEALPYAASFLCSYAATKARAEHLVLAANSRNLKTCALRPHLIWGPGDPHLIPRLLDRGRRELLRQVGDGNNLVDISYIDNVAHAHLLAADNLNSLATAAGNAYFISQGKPVNLWAWINDLFHRLEIPPVARRISYRKAYEIGRWLEYIYGLCSIRREPVMTRFLAEQLAKSHWFSMKRAQTDLGYQPLVTTEEGVEQLVSHFCQ
jgi:nucleoside-diphosphate-sugar epimerase